MVSFNPCHIFGNSLRHGVKVIACLYMFGSSVLIIFSLCEYGMHTSYGKTRDEEEHVRIDDDTAETYLYTFVFGLINFGLYLLLLHAATWKCRKLCWFWFSVSIIETSILAVRVFLYDVCYYRFEVGLLLFSLFSLWVVWKFIEQLGQDSKHTVLPVMAPSAHDNYQMEDKMKSQEADKASLILALKRWQKSKERPFIANSMAGIPL